MPDVGVSREAHGREMFYMFRQIAGVYRRHQSFRKISWFSKDDTELKFWDETEEKSRFDLGNFEVFMEHV